MRHQERDHERNMRRGTYGDTRNTRQGQSFQGRETREDREGRENHEAREGREDRWQSSGGENAYYGESQERGFGQSDRNDHSYAESYRGSWDRPSFGGSNENYSRREFGGQGYSSPDYGGNRSYSSGREDFGSNSRMGGGWSESSRQQQRGFYGKGPKGYKRSDERIQEEVHEALTWNRDIDASDIEVEVKEGEVSLTGNVADRRMKRLAEELIEDISGVKDVSNQLKIKKEMASESGSASSSEESSREGKNASGKKSQSTTGEKH